MRHTYQIRGMTSKVSLRHGFARSKTRRPSMLMSPKKGEIETAAQVMSVLIIGEVIQAVSRQVSSIIRSKIAKR